MKKWITTAAIIALTTSGFAQQKNAVQSYFEQYSNDESYTQITISGKMFEMMAHIEVESQEEQELKDAVSGIEGIQVLMKDSVANPKAQYQSALSQVGRRFESLMIVDNPNAKFEFFIDENSGVVEEMLIIGIGDHGFGIVDIWGEIDLKNLGPITQKMSIIGMEEFDGPKMQASREIKIYPNPIRQGNQVKMEIPEAMKGLEGRISDTKGSQLKTFRITKENIQLPTSELPSGTYVVSIWDGNTRVYNEQFIIVK
jgi:hypothetical protein